LHHLDSVNAVTTTSQSNQGSSNQIISNIKQSSPSSLSVSALNLGGVSLDYKDKQIFVEISPEGVTLPNIDISEVTSKIANAQQEFETILKTFKAPTIDLSSFGIEIEYKNKQFYVNFDSTKVPFPSIKLDFSEFKDRPLLTTTVRSDMPAPVTTPLPSRTPYWKEFFTDLNQQVNEGTISSKATSILSHFLSGIQSASSDWRVIMPAIVMTVIAADARQSAAQLRKIVEEQDWELEKIKKLEEEARNKAEEEKKQKIEWEKKMREETEARIKAEIEAKIKEEANARIEAEAIERTKAQAKLEAEMRMKVESMERMAALAEAKFREKSEDAIRAQADAIIALKDQQIQEIKIENAPFKTETKKRVVSRKKVDSTSEASNKILDLKSDSVIIEPTPQAVSRGKKASLEPKVTASTGSKKKAK
jgi:hypothetical protein